MEADLKNSLLLVEAIIVRTSVQLKFLQRVAGYMSEEHCRVHLLLLDMLQSQLLVATASIERLMNSTTSALKKLKYLFVKETIDETIAQLERWQRIFDPTWYLILRIGDKAIDTELAAGPGTPPGTSKSTKLVPAVKSLRDEIYGLKHTEPHTNLPDECLDWAGAKTIEHATTRIIQRTSPKSKSFIVDTIQCTSDLDVDSLRNLRDDSKSLARKLSRIEPEASGLLNCHGIVKRGNQDTRLLESINMIYNMPTSGPEPLSLRSHLLRPASYSITARLVIARQLASAISFIHACDFVHKNIRPETILVFPDGVRPLGSAYLVGFDSFRSVGLQTLRKGDHSWETNLYRHPSRQGIFVHGRYVMQHDVYSLGVCLLELGMWNSFVTLGSPRSSAAVSKSLELSDEDFEFVTRAGALQSDRVKNHLVKLAREHLPTRMGDRYTAVVVTCLTCLDSENEDFGDTDEMIDEDGVLIGVRFIEKVLFKLGAISI